MKKASKSENDSPLVLLYNLKCIILTQLTPMKLNLPGPLDPPFKSRPSLNITALSYSCTTC